MSEGEKEQAVGIVARQLVEMIESQCAVAEEVEREACARIVLALVTREDSLFPSDLGHLAAKTIRARSKQ